MYAMVIVKIPYMCLEQFPFKELNCNCGPLTVLLSRCAKKLRIFHFHWTVKSDHNILQPFPHNILKLFVSKLFTQGFPFDKYTVCSSVTAKNLVKLYAYH